MTDPEIRKEIEDVFLKIDLKNELKALVREREADEMFEAVKPIDKAIEQANRDICAGLGIPAHYFKIPDRIELTAIVAYQRQHDRTLIRYQQQLNVVVGKMVKCQAIPLKRRGRGAQRYWNRRLDRQRKRFAKSKAAMVYPRPRPRHF